MSDLMKRLTTPFATEGAILDLPTGQKGLEDLRDACREAAARIGALEAENARLQSHRERLERALTWYGENARLARLCHSEGDLGRSNPASDGGTRARAAMEPTNDHG